MLAIGIIVANVPQELLPTTTLSLAMATQRMARHNARLRRLPAAEALGSTTVICSDKTGTLTQNRMSVHGLWIGGAFMPRTDLATRPTVITDHHQLFVNTALCHNRREVGEQLRLMSPTQLQLALDGPEILVARVATEQKMWIVEALKQQGEIVAVSGDGVNDAPALKAAHSGLAMGISGSDVTEAAADVILLDDNFASIVAASEEGRALCDNRRKFLTYILSSNVPQIVPYLAFVLFRIPLPLTILQILAVDLGTDMLPALALGTEKPGAAVMQRPPRARDDRVLSWQLVATSSSGSSKRRRQ